MLQPGQILQNRYRISNVMGQGGMGAVYRAADQRLHTSCVVKELLITPDNVGKLTEAVAQFQREADTLASLRHPNLPRVYDYFLEQDNYYLVMDLIEGQSLHQLISTSHNLPESLVLDYADQLLSVLEYIHGKGVLHRDIKPANIIVQSDGRVVLVDFGLVKQTDAGQGTKSFLRGLGTPQYAPPEQYTGGTDQRSDLYSLAATLYYALTGQIPPSVTEQMSGIPLIPVRQISGDVSANTESVIMRALNMDRNTRYANASAMRADIKAARSILEQSNVTQTISPKQVIPSAVPAQSTTAGAGRLQTRWAFMVGIAAIVVVGGLLVMLSRQISPEPLPTPQVSLATVTTMKAANPTSPSSTATSAVENQAPTASPVQPSLTALPDIKVALLAPLSGPVPTFGVSTRDGVLMAIDEWNARGGIGGRKIVPVVEDSQCAPDPAVNAANKVIDQDKVKFIIGEVCSKASIPVSEIANARKVIMVSPSSSNPDVTVGKDGKTKDYIFRACFIDSFQGQVGAKFALDTLQVRTAFVMVDPTNVYSAGLADAFERSFTNRGGKIVGKENYSGMDTDFSTLLTKVANTRPELIYLPDYYNVVNLVTKQAREKGITAPFLGGDGWDSTDLDTRATYGSYFTNHYSGEDTDPEVVNFVKAYGIKYQDDMGQPKTPDAFAALAYDASNLLFNAIRIAGSDDTDKVKDALAGINFSGVTGKLVYDDAHNPQKSTVVMQVRSGMIIFSAKVNP